MLKDSKAISGFAVNDIGAAIEFYHDVLGLDATETLRGMELNLHSQTGTTQIFVYPKSEHQPATFTVLNFRVDDVKSVVEDLIEKGVHFEQYDDEWIKTDEIGVSWNDNKDLGPTGIAWFKDPAGNILSIVQE